MNRLCNLHKISIKIGYNGEQTFYRGVALDEQVITYHFAQCGRHYRWV